MSAAAGAGTAKGHGRVPWGDVLMSAVAAVSWALIGMAGTAALGLRLLQADSAGSLGPMTAAVVALGAGGSVTPSGDVSVFGLSGAEADTAIEITPLGVSLVGAVLLSWFFLRSLRGVGVVIAPSELLARAGSVVVLFVAMLGGLAWAGHDVITIDGGSLGLDDVTGGSGSVEIPGLGDIGGLLPDRLGDLVDAQATVGFTVDTAPTLLGGFGWSAGILLVALLASRRTPLPRGWEAVHRVVRPAVSALVTVLLVAVAAGWAAAASAAVGDGHPRRIAGAALLGAPNGVWLGLPLGLFVPWDGRATGELTRFLPDPLGGLLGTGSDRPVTLGRLADLDGRVWLLGVAAALTMLLAGVLAAVRTPVGAADGALRFAGRCAPAVGAATALALPLLVWLTDVSVTASLSVLGFDALGAGIALHGHLGAALLLGGVWGAGAGAAGALLAWGCGAAGRRATAWAQGEAVAGAGGAADVPGAVWGERGASAGQAEARGVSGPAGRGDGAGQGWPGTSGTVRHGDAAGAGQPGERGGWVPRGEGAGPYEPGTPYRPPDPGTNPYLRVPEELREPEDARPPGVERHPGAEPSGAERPSVVERPPGEERPSGAAPGPGYDAVRDDEPPAPGDLYSAPTVVRPVGPPPRGPRQSPGPRNGNGPPARPDDGPPPPPPPPPPPRKPRGGK
ncbi:streptophobe family protein [Streptomyces tibetensis]|uniref:streptophobe family protein n=1 Tax=Streptomyces tibetensis TaxID=2382123 RepID=UPI00340CB903